MKVEGDHFFNATRQQVWELFRDTEVMAAALPGTKQMEAVGENEYQAVMHIRVGPVSGEFSGNLVISNESFPESYTMTVEGKGKPGFMKGTGDILLVEQPTGGTLLKYTGEVQIGGKLAAVGQRLIDTVSKSMINQAFEILDQVLTEKTAAEVEGRKAEYQTTSEAEVAGAVLKDLFTGLVASPWAKWVVGFVLLVIIGLIILLLLT
jgi:carbon monoxide dehydrogenase subunit G